MSEALTHGQFHFPAMKLPLTLLIACLGAAPLCAQQVEPNAEAPKPATGAGNPNGELRADGPASTTPTGHRYEHGNGMPERKPVAYIGLLTREVPPELRAQFSLAEGFGLLVEEVMPDSPAKGAGLKVFDVLLKFEDQQLVNMEQFMSLVRSKKVGDVVHLAVITGGKETQVPVTLGEHMVETRKHQEHRGFPNQGNAMQENMERLHHMQQEMREYQERVQQWSKGGGNGPMPQAPMLRLPGHGDEQPSREGGRHPTGRQPQTGISIPPGTDLERFKVSQSQSSANVTRRDASGEYTLKNENGYKTFIARPSNGQEQSWPINTDAERQAVPEEMLDKLRMMDGAGSGARIEINPGHPAPAGRGSAPALPPGKAQTTSA